MSKMQTAMARRPLTTSGQPAAVARTTRAVEPPRTVSTRDPVLNPVREAISAVMRVRIMWFALLANTLIIPALIIFIAAAFDVIPLKSSIGAFIIAAGAISICLSFPFADQFRSTNAELIKEAERDQRFDARRGQKLMRLLFIGAMCAELPSIAGLVYFFATREIIASMLLCAPAIGLMLVAFHPVEPIVRKRASAANVTKP